MHICLFLENKVTVFLNSFHAWLLLSLEDFLVWGFFSQKRLRIESVCWSTYLFYWSRLKLTVPGNQAFLASGPLAPVRFSNTSRPYSSAPWRLSSPCFWATQLGFLTSVPVACWCFRIGTRCCTTRAPTTSPRCTAPTKPSTRCRYLWRLRGILV